MSGRGAERRSHPIRVAGRRRPRRGRDEIFSGEPNVGASSLILYAATVTNAAFMVIVAVLTFVFQSYRWWYPIEDPRPEDAGDGAIPGRGLLLVAARHEESVLGATLQRLAELDYPSYLVGVIIDHPDDPGTLAVAHEAQARHPDLIHIIRYPEDTDVHNKPIGLNAALRPHRAGRPLWLQHTKDTS